MRHAVYFAPEPETALHDVGSRWLGRDAFSGGALPQPDLPGISELTAEARRYGFHATLKPPFAIADGMDAQGLVSAMKAVCGSLSPLSVELKVNLVDGFLALVPKGHSRRSIRSRHAACGSSTASAGLLASPKMPSGGRQG